MFKLKTLSALHLVSTVCLMLLIPVNGQADTDSTPFDPYPPNADLICQDAAFSWWFCKKFKIPGRTIFSQDRMLINDKEYKVVKTEGMTMMTDETGNYTLVLPNIRETEDGVEVEYEVVTNDTRERFAYSLHNEPSKGEVLFAKEIEEDMSDYLRISLGGSDPGVSGPKYDECIVKWAAVPFSAVGCFLANAHIVEDD